MKTKHAILLASMLAALLLLGSVAAQEPVPQPPDPPPAPRGGGDPVVQVGSDLDVAVGERVEDVVSILGNAAVAGHVEGDVVALLSTATLAPTAVIEGDFVAVGGPVTVEPGAVIDGDVVVVGGSFNVPPDFSPGGDQVVVGSLPGMWDFTPVLRWITEGLLLGRLIVPDLAWVWVFVLVQLLLFLATNLVFERPVRTCAAVLAGKPLTAILAGILVVLLSGPVTLVLVVSVIGLPVVPLLWIVLFLAGFFGQVSVARWVGGNIVAEAVPGDRLQATRSVAIGFGALCLAYMVPVLGITVWLMAGVMGLGAAAATFFEGLRREHPTPAGPADPASSVEADRPDLSPTGPVDMPLASFASRLGALALDVVLLAIVCGLAKLPGRWAFAVVLVYHVALWSWISTTVGGIICQVRVVRADHSPLRTTDALVRGLAGIFSVVVAGLGWFWILWDVRRQSWHDRIAGTYVVRVPPGERLPSR